LVRVVLIEPKFEGNIGFIARLMANFGFEDLVLVNPVEIGDEARIHASNAEYLLEEARVCSSFSEATMDVDVKVATTGIRGETDNSHVRMPCLTPKQLKKKIGGLETALIFGKEDHGLPNHIIRECEMVVSIPTSSNYPVMNLSHAVGILLYELSDQEQTEVARPNQKELDVLQKKLKSLLDNIDYPSHKKNKTTTMMKRILGRAELTKRETYTLLGVIRETLRKIKEK